MKAKYITLHPKDFNFKVDEDDEVGEYLDNNPIPKALKRNGIKITHFQYSYIETKDKSYKVKDSFKFIDFLYVKEQYRKDRKMKECCYFITLIEL